MATPGTGTAAALRAIVGELGDHFYERDETARALVLAMLAGQHSLMIGPPGTAKSELSRELTSRVTGARYWEILLSKYVGPGQIFGPVDVAALCEEPPRYTQVFADRATQCEIGFIDEIFKCGDAALNSMLAFLNERVYHPESGGTPIACPLISAITASNELPPGEELAAIYDRLLVRLEVGYIVDPSNFMSLLDSAVAAPTPPARTTVSLDALQHAVEKEVPAIDLPASARDAISTLRAALRRQELIASDRRWRQSVRLLQASAYLDGRSEVGENDLTVLSHVLWDSTSQRATVEREVLQLVNPNAREALDLLDAIDELEAQLDSKAGQSRDALSEWAIKEANTKLRRAGSKLGKLRRDSVAAGRSTATLDRVIARQKAVHGRIMVEALGIDPSMVGGA